jgi:hypothetical protein
MQHGVLPPQANPFPQVPFLLLGRFAHGGGALTSAGWELPGGCAELDGAPGFGFALGGGATIGGGAASEGGVPAEMGFFERHIPKSGLHPSPHHGSVVPLLVVSISARAASLKLTTSPPGYSTPRT